MTIFLFNNGNIYYLRARVIVGDKRFHFHSSTCEQVLVGVGRNCWLRFVSFTRPTDGRHLLQE